MVKNKEMFNTSINYDKVFEVLDRIFTLELNNIKIIIGTEEGLIFFTNVEYGEKLVASFKKIFDILYSVGHKHISLFKKILVQSNEKYLTLVPLNIDFDNYIVWIEFPKGYSSKKCMLKTESILRRIKKIFA